MSVQDKEFPPGGQFPLIAPFGLIGPLAHRPGQMVRLARTTGGELNLDIGCFREEPCWRFGEQKELQTAEPRGQLVSRPRDFDVFVMAHVTIEE